MTYPAEEAKYLPCNVCTKKKYVCNTGCLDFRRYIKAKSVMQLKKNYHVFAVSMGVKL